MKLLLTFKDAMFRSRQHRGIISYNVSFL